MLTKGLVLKHRLHRCNSTCRTEETGGYVSKARYEVPEAYWPSLPSPGPDLPRRSSFFSEQLCLKNSTVASLKLLDLDHRLRLFSPSLSFIPPSPPQGLVLHHALTAPPHFSYTGIGPIKSLMCQVSASH